MGDVKDKINDEEKKESTLDALHRLLEDPRLKGYFFVDLTLLFNEAWQQCYKGGRVNKSLIAQLFNTYISEINELNSLPWDADRFELWNRDLQDVYVREELSFLIQPRRILINPGFALSNNLKPKIWYYIKDFKVKEDDKFEWKNESPTHNEFINAVTDWNNRLYGIKSEEMAHTTPFLNLWKDVAFNDVIERFGIIEAKKVSVANYQSQKTWPIYISGDGWMKEVFRNYGYWSQDWEDWFSMFLEFTKPRFK